jgi:hypothetical protein
MSKIWYLVEWDQRNTFINSYILLKPLLSCLLAICCLITYLILEADAEHNITQIDYYFRIILIYTRKTFLSIEFTSKSVVACNHMHNEQVS